MLMLSRTSKPGKNEIYLDEKIKITFLDCTQNTVRLGIEDLTSHRTEIRRGELKSKPKGKE